MTREHKSTLLRNETLVRVGPLFNLPTTLRSLGCDPKPLITNAGLKLIQFKDPDNWISIKAAGKLLAQCVTATQCQHFGLLLGEQISPSHLGMPGFQLRTAPDVRTALHNLIKHIDLHDQSGFITLLTNGDTSSFGWTISQSEVEGIEQIYDISIVVICNIMRSLCGPNWNPHKVLLSQPQPKDLKPYKCVFRAPIIFNADKNCVVFETQCLSHPLPTYDPLLLQYFEKQAGKLHQQQKKDFVNQLHQLLYYVLEYKECSEANIARQLNIHERTLHRRLKLYDTSFRHELEQVRYAISKHLLMDTQEPIEKIASSIGFAHSSAFCRAFKKWSGVSPTKWRAQVSGARR